MKPILFAAALFYSLFNYAALELSSPLDSMCENGGEMTDCGKEKSFYFTDDGHCGCFFPQEITEPNICMSAKFRCTENSIFTFINRWDYSFTNDTPVLAGCGCFIMPQ